MSSVTPPHVSTSRREPTFRPPDAFSRSRLLQAQAETRSSADFTFLTAEGDKVTLSANTLRQASYTRYDARGTLQGQRLRARTEELTFASTQNSAFSIEGDLSAEELQDIQEVVRQVSALAQEVFTGGETQELDQALDFDDLSTLQSFEAILEYSQSLSLSRITQKPAHGRNTFVEAPLSRPDVSAATTLTSTSTSQLLLELRAAETSPALAESRPAPVETSPAPVETSPAPVETSPALAETSPALVETSPAPVETSPVLAEPSGRPEVTAEGRRPAGVFGTFEQLFEAVKQAIAINQRTGEVRQPHGESGQESITTLRSKHSRVFRTLTETLADRATRGDRHTRQALSQLASQFLQRLQVLGQPEAVQATAVPVVPSDAPSQSADSTTPSPLAA